MPLPALQNWEPTRDSLHAVAHLLTDLRRHFSEPLPNALRLSLYVTPQGLSTGKLPIGEFLLDIHGGALEIIPAAGEHKLFKLSSFADTAALMEALLPYTGEPFDTRMDAPLQVDSHHASDYALVLDQIYTGLARFKARLGGTMTPLVVWGHHFDLSFLWFPRQVADENEAHLNFGFSPFSPGLPYPYLYSYAYPLPDGLLSQPLPAPARWHTEGWTGALVDYEALAQAENPAAEIETMCMTFYEVMSPLLTKA